jgi:hypothetical protein
MAKPSIALRVVSGLVSMVALVALVDDLGKYRWFWPYDREIYGSAILVIVVWYAFCGPKIQAWAEEEQTKLDREDDGGT